MLQSPSFRRAWGGRGGQWTDKQADVSDSRVMGPVCGRGGDCHPGAQEGHLWRGGSPREGRHRNFTGLVPGCSGPLLCVCVCVCEYCWWPPSCLPCGPLETSANAALLQPRNVTGAGPGPCSSRWPCRADGAQASRPALPSTPV